MFLFSGRHLPVRTSKKTKGKLLIVYQKVIAEENIRETS